MRDDPSSPRQAGADAHVRSVGLGGLGSIGLPVAAALDKGIDGFRLTRVGVRDQARAEGLLAGFRNPPALVSLKEAAECDVVIETLPSSAFDRLVVPAIERGRTVIIASGGALLSRPELIARAKETGARLHVPSGALGGLDALKAAVRGDVDEVRIETRKPPYSLKGAPYLVRNGIELSSEGEAMQVFEGNALEAAEAFPANTNVAAALALAGVGPALTRVEIWSDPALVHNTHCVRVRSEAANFELRIEIVPNPENPRSGRLTPLSILALLDGLNQTLVVGT